MENHLLCYTQSLPPSGTKNWLVSSSIVIYAAKNIIELCVGCAQVSNSTLSIYISHSVNWSVFVEPRGSGRLLYVMLE